MTDLKNYLEILMRVDGLANDSILLPGLKVKDVYKLTGIKLSENEDDNIIEDLAIHFGKEEDEKLLKVMLNYINNSNQEYISNICKSEKFIKVYNIYKN